MAREADLKRATRWAWLVVASTVVAVGCGPVAAPGAGETAAPQREAVRTLVAIAGEPDMLARPLDPVGSYPLLARMANAGLGIRDAREVPVPYLAEALPQLHTETWKVSPDGRMETAYRLRANITWHDGTPLSVDDFAFAWRVYTTPELGVPSSGPHAYMETVSAADARTLVIQWTRPYVDAGILAEDFLPLPRHIVEPLYQQTRGARDAFFNHPFWTREYVGLGPYRVGRWEPGAFIEASAFEGHVLGRAKTDQIRLLPIDDPNTIVANLIAGTAHLTDDITPQHALVLKREWARSNGGSILLNPSQTRFTQFQMRPELATPKAVLDLRVRKALAHTVDKQAINDVRFDGEGLMADTVISPTVDYFAEIDRAIAKYPHDPRRAEQLMSEAGFAKGPDGGYISPTDGRFSIELWQAYPQAEEQELVLMADVWKRAGLEARPYALSPAQLGDGQLKASFPGLLTTGGPINDRGLRAFGSAAIPTAEKRWGGGINFGGWSNPDYDRLLAAFDTTLDRQERIRQIVQMTKLVSEDLPWILLYITGKIVGHVATVTGPQVTSYTSATAWNVHEWELR